MPGPNNRFLEDVNLAWTLAEQNQNIGLQCRYALIIASFKSLAKNIPGTLLRALVHHGIWSPAQGMAYARQIPTAEDRIECFVKLNPYLPQMLRESALRDALTAAQDESSRAWALTGLAPHLPDALLQDALTAVQEIEDEWARAAALIGLAPHLPDALRPAAFQDALTGTQAIENEWVRAAALTELAPHLPDALLQDALTTAQRRR